MPGRIDYHDDPGAPEPNSLVPAVTVIVTREEDGAVLLICRTDNGNWSLPGGAVELRESVTQAAVRETLEETGIRCRVTGISGIYSDPGHIIHYTSNDEVRREFTIVLTAAPDGGEPTASDESREVRWVAPRDLRGYPMDSSMRRRVDDYLDRPGIPVIA
jgi:8-oxo-dGTP pyrophosphatase MutT (NUDIX family)